MGAWGVGIRQDDFVCDVEGAFEDQLKGGKTIDEATRFVHGHFATAVEDVDDGHLFWLALAGLACGYMLLKMFAFFDQKNQAAVATILPVLLGFAAAAGLSWKRI